MSLFLRRMRMVAAPVDAGAGGAGGDGGGGAPAGGVRSPASPAGDPNPFPLTSGRPAAKPDAGGGAPEEDELETAIREDAEGRGIPHDRVRQMRTSWETRARERALATAREALTKDFAPILQELGELRQLRDQFQPGAIESGIAKKFLEALGVKQEPEKPSYVTIQDFQKALKDHREEFNREATHRAELERAHIDLEGGRKKHEKMFKSFPNIEEIAAALWGSPSAMKSGVSMATILDGLAEQFEKAVGKWNEEYVEQKEQERHELPIKPGQTPAPGKKAAKPDYSAEGTSKAAIAFLEDAEKGRSRRTG